MVEVNPWISIDEFSTGDMVTLARDRAMVILDSGRTARLVRWPGRHTEASRGQRARVQFESGRSLTVPCGQVVGVDPESRLHDGPRSASMST